MLENLLDGSPYDGGMMKNAIEVLFYCHYIMFIVRNQGVIKTRKILVNKKIR